MLDHPAHVDAGRLAARAGLSERVAELLAERIASGTLTPGARLDSEGDMARQFGVSRTVVREAVSRLKSDGLLDSRQGSGVFVREHATRPLRIAPLTSLDELLHIITLRRAIEAEAAALAAEHRSAAELRAIEAAEKAIDVAVSAGRDGVAEDVAFHRRIAEASRNPYLLGVLSFVEQHLRKATTVTRANEARRALFMRQVREEHRAVVAAIRARDPAAARRAAARHMENAAKRMRDADPDLLAGAPRPATRKRART
jgi:GntR family transcriptional repressor for pyruvate dehydrogenase complex